MNANDSDWEPPPGMTKLVCERCNKYFSSAGLKICANCEARRKREEKRADLGYNFKGGRGE